MAIGKYRFLYDNKITAASQITFNSIHDGHAQGAVKRGTGSAVMVTSGIFTGAVDTKYTIIIDDISAGTEIGQSTIEWQKDDVLQASGVSTSGIISLNDGISISFTGGTGSDFALGDRWDFYAVNEFGTERLIDLDRDTRYRSRDGSAASATITMTFDFGSAQTIDSVIILDHNVSASGPGTITLSANTSDSWGSPAFTQSLTVTDTSILQYFTSQTYQYWRLSFTDTSNSDGYIEVSNIFLGPYFEQSKAVPTSHKLFRNLFIERQETGAGVIRRKYEGQQQMFSGSIQHLTQTDMDNFYSMIDAITDKNNHTIKPVYFNLDSENTTDFWLMEFSNIPVTRPLGSINGVVYHTLQLDLREIVNSGD